MPRPPLDPIMASIEADESSMIEELTFLDLQDCTPETRSYLLSLIENETKQPKPSPAAVSKDEATGAGLQAQQQQQTQPLSHFQ